MANFHFFTEVDLLTNQTKAQSFGPVTGFEQYKYLVTDKHTASADPKAFAICDGVVFIQEIPGTNNVNLVLRPSKQPPFSFPKIRFFIYRNILKSSLINGADIAAASTNDLTQSIWNSQAAYNATTGTNANPPKEALGTDITANIEIESVFFRENSSFQFPVVKGGWSIGKFDRNGFGFEIMTDAIGYDPLLQIIRTPENVIEVTPLAVSPTPMQEFLHWNEKEAVLNYIDPAAFFGSFYNYTINCRNTSGNTVVGANAVYDQVLKGAHLTAGTDGVFFNRNKIYLDIRNEYNFSINYFKNYGINIQAAYDVSQPLTTLNYYGGLWPLCVLNNVFPATVAAQSLALRLTLPGGNGDNPLPTVYLASGYWKNSYPQEPKKQNKLIDLTVTGNSTNEIALSIPKHTAISQTTPICSYIKVKYFKRFDINVSPPPSAGTVVRAEHYLDNIFRPLAMKIFYTTPNAVKTRFYDEEFFVDMNGDGGFDFVGKTGIADDGVNITLTILPAIIRSATLNDFSLPQISSEMSRSFPDYISYLSNKFPNKKVRKSNFDFTGTGANVTYLEIIDREGAEPDSIDEPQLAGITTIGFNKAAFQAINTSAFIPNLPVFLVARNWQSGTDNIGQFYTSAEIGLLGFTANGSNVEAGEITSSIKIFFYERN